MFSDNHKISDSQIKKMLVFDICSVSILILPGIAATGAGRDGLVSIIAGSAAAVIYILVLLYFTKKIDGDFIPFSQKTAGKFLTLIFALLYLIKLAFSAVFILTLFSNVIVESLLPNTSYKLILFTLVITSVYCASKGIEVRARIAEILFFIVIVPLFLLFLLGLAKVDFTNLLPLFTEKATDISKTSYSILLLYSAAEIVLFAAPMLVDENQKSKRTRSTISAVVIAAALNTLLFIVVIGLLGPSGASEKIWSSISILQVIEIPGGFVQRQDAIILTFWLMSIFTITTTFFYYLTKITSDILPIKKKQYYLFAYAVILYFIAARPLNMDMLYSWYRTYLAYIGFPQSLLIPLIIIAAAKLRTSRKGESHED